MKTLTVILSFIRSTVLAVIGVSFAMWVSISFMVTMEHLHHVQQLETYGTTTTEINQMLGGCMVVYESCKIEVVGSQPRLVPGIFNGVIIK